jgi:hypothetical protein
MWVVMEMAAVVVMMVMVERVDAYNGQYASSVESQRGEPLFSKLQSPQTTH